MNQALRLDRRNVLEFWKVVLSFLLTTVVFVINFLLFTTMHDKKLTILFFFNSGY